MEEQATAEQQTGTTGPEQTGQAPAGSTGQADPWAGYQWDGNVDSLPEPVAKVIRDARADAGKARTGAKQQAAEDARNDLVRQLLAVIDPKAAEQQQPNPEQLTKQLAEMAETDRTKDGALREKDIELAIWRNADTVGADAKALTDSKGFTRQLAELDPAASDFAAKVQEQMRQHIEQYPNYRRAGQVPLRSGGEFTGRPGVADPEPATPQERLRRGYATTT